MFDATDGAATVRANPVPESLRRILPSPNIAIFSAVEASATDNTCPDVYAANATDVVKAPVPSTKNPNNPAVPRWHCTPLAA
jgi:hypothetical protein